MKLLREKYYKLRAWIEWRDIRLADVLISGLASIVLIGVVALILGTLL